MKPTLVILAAGMASRYGSMKQIQSFGPDGETIMDYSIYDAIRAGFGKVVFIIRKDFEQDFKNIFEPKLKGKITTEYAFQSIHAFINGYSVPSDRTKPWGTAHAVLCARDLVKEPFCVINADDFYGQDGFVKAYDFLMNKCSSNTYGIIGYHLAKTLSEHGTVSRGVCQVDAQGNLLEITERTKIYRDGGGKIVFEEGDGLHALPEDTKVSMNFWCFHPGVFEYTEKLFYEFVSMNLENPKAEFFIPLVADQFVKAGNQIEMVPTSSQWFGVTYKEDAPVVQASINALVAGGEYPNSLWGK
jgi:NDP-sugar pyrophosphorylase family protein